MKDTASSITTHAHIINLSRREVNKKTLKQQITNFFRLKNYLK